VKKINAEVAQFLPASLTSLFRRARRGDPLLQRNVLRAAILLTPPKFNIGPSEPCNSVARKRFYAIAPSQPI
jgi:hypothetical protein